MDRGMTTGPYIVTIVPDDDPMNPLEFIDVPIAIFHRDYDHLSTVELNDYGIYRDYGQWIISDDVRDDVEVSSIEDVADHLRKAYGAEVMLIKAYIHSGITISASPVVYGRYPDQMWDVSHEFGLIFMTRDQIAAMNGAHRVSKKMRADCRDIMVGTIEELSAYLEGDVWSIRIEDADGNDVDSLSSVVGFDHAERLANEMVRDAAMREYVDGNTYVSGDGSVRSIRLDDGSGGTVSYVRITRDDTTRPHWRAVVDRANLDDRSVLVHRGKLGACIEAAFDHFVDVMLGAEADWLGVLRFDPREEAA